MTAPRLGVKIVLWRDIADKRLTTAQMLTRSRLPHRFKNSSQAESGLRCGKHAHSEEKLDRRQNLQIWFCKEATALLIL